MSAIVVAGDSSGSITIAAPAVAGSGTLTLPVATDTLAGIAATQTLTNKTLVAPALGTVASGVISACTSTGMVMVAPALGTPVSGVLTNCTGTSTALNAGIGVGQTWQNMGRSAGVTYTNSTSKPIFVLITCVSGGSNIAGTVDGLTFYSGVGSGAYYNASTIYLIIPVGSTYSTNSFGAGSQSWYELR